MITENLSTLKIHKLTQAQYDRELANGNIDADALYLTPDEEIDLTLYATTEQLNEKADASHIHAISDVTNLQVVLDGKADTSHEHDYAGKIVTGTVYTIDETEVTAGTGAEIFNDYTNNIATGNYSHAEGAETIASGNYSHASGIRATASGTGSFAHGIDATASGEYSFATGDYVFASGMGAHATGGYVSASGNYSHAEGMNTRATAYCAHAEGYGNKATGDYSHAEGNGTEASGSCAHAEGYGNKATGDDSHAEGNGTEASGSCAHAEGIDTTASGEASHAGGYDTIAASYQHVCGKYNTETAAPESVDTQDSGGSDALFIVGYGTSETRANAFRIASNGKCKGVSSFSGSGADFAELFEWADGNPDNEDRRGLFVTLDGEKIKLANDGDDYIGVISSAQAFIGNAASEEWQGKYLTDVFGAKISHEVEIPAKVNEDGEIVRPAHTAVQFVINPDYNPSEDYVMRESRKEWGIVGLLGQVVIIDDGTCVVGGYAKPSANGVGTAANEGYRVMRRVDDNHIKVLVK